VLLGEGKREPARFRLVLTQEMGANRKTGSRKPGFIESILNLIETFYGSVVQNITPWTPKAPKISAPPSMAASVDDDVTPTIDEQPSTPFVLPSDSAPSPPPSSDPWSS